jgi:lipopolysaccharide export system protein LptA
LRAFSESIEANVFRRCADNIDEALPEARGPMRITIERLRAGVLVLGVLLVVAVAGFLGYARYRGHKLLSDLPHQLGMQIQQSADGFTYSQSHGGHTLFTLHASKVVQYKDKGRASLHDVSILLYGPDGKRTDRISGQDFDYDPSSGIAQAQGEVQIDLQNPGQPQANLKAGPQAGSGLPAVATGTGVSGNIRVKTSGLVFNQKTGLATTTQAVDFEFPQASGKATGASYDSEKGVLILNHAVEIDSTSDDGSPVVVHASSAQLVRDSHQGFFEQIAWRYRGDRMSAEHATLLFRDDGSAQQINASGKIHLETDTGTVVDSKTGVMQMDAHSQPLKAHLTEGVAFHSYDAQRKVNGNAGEGVVTFGEKGILRHATLSNLVSMVDLEIGLPGDPGGTATRQVQSQQLDVDFTSGTSPSAVKGSMQHPPSQNRRTVLKAALAQGDAKVAFRTNPSEGAKQDTAVAADHLLASFSESSAITKLTGSGHTRLTDISANGVTQTSTGDDLVIKFMPVRGSGSDARVQVQPGKAAKSTGVSGDNSTQIESAVQQGNVTMEQAAANSSAPATAPSSALGPVAFRASAQKATYTAVSQMLHLEGSPRVTNGELDLTSTLLDYSRITGDAVANGDVKATYFRTSGFAGGHPIGGQAGDHRGQDAHDAPLGVLDGPGPTHIIAAQATLVRVSGDAIFRGQARLWQGTDSIAAPVIELSRAHRTLKAHGETDGGPALVNATLLSASGTVTTPGPANGGAPSTGSSELTGTRRQPAVVRIKSRQMTYSDAERDASFRGGVIADDGAETVRSDEADVFLAPAAVAAKIPIPKADNLAGSQVDHIIATGHVVIQQPGRRGAGDKLVYGAKDGNFVLTGTDAVRPTLSDARHGTVTGDSLIFNSRDDSVTVSGGSSGAVARTRSPR